LNAALPDWRSIKIRSQLCDAPELFAGINDGSPIHRIAGCRGLDSGEALLGIRMVASYLTFSALDLRFNFDAKFNVSKSLA
jgi:hypothetical protein